MGGEISLLRILPLRPSAVFGMKDAEPINIEQAARTSALPMKPVCNRFRYTFEHHCQTAHLMNLARRCWLAAQRRPRATYCESDDHIWTRSKEAEEYAFRFPIKPMIIRDNGDYRPMADSVPILEYPN